jgi:hypothetical protein
MSGDIDWIQGLLFGLVFMCAYGFHNIGKDFNRTIREHDRICNDLYRLEQKIDSIESGLTELRSRE